jgi:hypothetical protein
MALPTVIGVLNETQSMSRTTLEQRLKRIYGLDIFKAQLQNIHHGGNTHMLLDRIPLSWCDVRIEYAI